MHRVNRRDSANHLHQKVKFICNLSSSLFSLEILLVLLSFALASFPFVYLEFLQAPFVVIKAPLFVLIYTEFYRKR